MKSWMPLVIYLINLYKKSFMSDKKERILNIRKKIQDYNKFIMEYGFNRDNDIFIKENISKILKELDELENELKNEK